MRSRLTAVILGSALLAVVPAAAQEAPLEKGFKHAARLNLGISFYDSGFFNCAYWGPFYSNYSCGTGQYVSYIPFTAGGQLDLNLGGPHNISVGFNALIGKATATLYFPSFAQSVSKTVTLWQPTLDYVIKYGPPSQVTVGRFRVGPGLYFGPESGFGGTLRLGGGASFFNNHRIGFGFDLVAEGGVYRGEYFAGVQLLVSPELHF
ncbi:MAG: hypothetical protein QM765_28805 [Myxococcales bacterium]